MSEQPNAIPLAKMSDINDGGSAFPADPHFSYPGMTLRDWFAGQAMAVMANEGHSVPVDADQYRNLAKGLYLFADAMLIERAKTTTP